MSERVRRKERDKFIAFYVSNDEKQKIVKAASAHDMSISDYCRKKLLKDDSAEKELKD